MRFASLPGVFLLALVALFVLPSTAVFWTDWLWFIETGYLPVFQRAAKQEIDIGPDILSVCLNP